LSSSKKFLSDAITPLVSHVCIKNISEVLRDRIVLYQTLLNIHKTFVLCSHHICVYDLCNA